MRIIQQWVIGLFTAVSVAHAAPFVSPMFGDNMVLQRDRTNIVWGWTVPGQTVRVDIAGQIATATAGADGRWQARLMPPETGGPYTLTVTGGTNVLFTNVLVGDVWLCGGQSNMEWPLARARNGDAELNAANHPQLRLFNVRSRSAYAPVSEAVGAWKVCTPQTATEDGGVSAVGYFFARKIQSETNIPIGLIKDCIGGTPAESWASATALRSHGDFDAALKEVERLHSKGVPEYGNFISHWYDEFDVGQKENWQAAGLDAADWKPVTLPGGFVELGLPESPALGYFRKTVVLPDPLPAGTARLRLGVVERMDTAYVNGRWVGASAWVENPRNYAIPGDLLKPGTNVITVRVFKTKPDGGFKSNPEQLKLVLGDKSEIPLAGDWKGKVSVDAQPPHPMPQGFENWPTMPSVLYNGMIAPVAPFGIRGAIWYQGEANASRAFQYRTLLPAMIADWRRAFGQGDFPFYIVSLAAFMQHKDTPGDDWWAELREAQALTAATVPNSGLAIAIDVGDANDIHPTDKKPVGERLALWALARDYGRNVVCSGPVFDRVETLPGALRLHFKNTDGGLVVNGDTPAEFAIAGADRKWFWAEAKVDGDTIIVSSQSVPDPKAARYAWQSNPVAALFNGAGLPAVPFRTDDWPLTTANVR
ncbi:MAG TPA: sialate O-acetylesterase [Verrucomicrobiota bacterium]|nr:sialate O-acetylesterase [Verrucomicrobiota bacterium]